MSSPARPIQSPESVNASPLSPRLRGWLPLAAILALAAGLRLFGLDLIDLRYDEAVAPVFAMNIAAGQWLPVAPFSGSVANHPPLYLYVLAAPYVFTSDVLLIAGYRAMLDVAAVAGCWALAARYFNRRTAHIAGLLFAVAPWAVQFARKLWVAPLPIFTLVVLFGLLEVAQRRNARGWAVAGLGLALCTGAHLTGLFLIPAVVALAVFRRDTLRVQPLAAGLVPLALLAAVYLGFDASQGFANVRGALGLRPVAAAAAPNPLQAINLALWGTGGSHLSDLTGPSFDLWPGQLPDVFAGLDGLQVAAFVASLLACAVAARTAASPRGVIGPTGASGATTLAFIWLIPAALLVVSRQPQMHYFSALYPIPFVLMGILIDAMMGPPTVTSPTGEVYRSPYVTIGVAFVAALTAWQAASTIAFTSFTADHPTSIAPVRFPLQAAAAARASPDDEVIAVAPGADPTVNEHAAILRAVFGRAPHRFVDANAGLALPASPAGYVFSPGSDRARSELERLTRLTSTSHGLGGAGGGFVAARAEVASSAGFLPLPAGRWEHGVQTVGYQAARSDGRLVLRVLLRATRAAGDATDVHWFNHWLADGRTASQADSGGVPPAAWRPGDLLLHWFELPVPDPAPPRPWTIKIGSYRFPQGDAIGVQVNGTYADGVLIQLEAQP